MTSFSKFSKSLAVAIRRLKRLYRSLSIYILIVLLLYHDYCILLSIALSYYLTDVSLHCANCIKHLLTSELKKTRRSKFRQWEAPAVELAKKQQSTRYSFPFLRNVLCSMEPTLTAHKELDAFRVRFGYSIFRSDLPRGEGTDPVSLRRRFNSKLFLLRKKSVFRGFVAGLGWKSSRSKRRLV